MSGVRVPKSLAVVAVLVVCRCRRVSVVAGPVERGRISVVVGLADRGRGRRFSAVDFVEYGRRLPMMAACVDRTCGCRFLH